MSEYTNFLKVGTCGLVLQMIEDRYLHKDLSLRNPVGAIQDIAYDASCKRRLRLDDGRAYSPIEIQREYCERAQKYIEQHPVSADHRDVVATWQSVLDCLDDDPNRLDRKVDWVIKRRLFESYVDSHGLSWGDPRIFLLDLKYHDIHRQRGLYRLLERRGAVERRFTEAEIIRAKTEPPADTRARVRGEFIKLARERSIEYDLDWSAIRIENLLNLRKARLSERSSPARHRSAAVR